VTSALENVKCAAASPLPEPPRLGWLARWCGAGRVVEQHRNLLAHLEERLSAVKPEELAPLETVAKPLEGAFAGLQMGLQRLERALERNGVVPILAVGRQFDPEQMEVLEGVPGTGRPAGEVIEELRRGYLWNGRLFRCAQVRVAR
jgi:molecular chaperone GrpE (heat shock protein)